MRSYLSVLAVYKSLPPCHEVVSFVDVEKVAYLLHISIFPLALLLVVSRICCISWLESNMYFPDESGK